MGKANDNTVLICSECRPYMMGLSLISNKILRFLASNHAEGDTIEINQTNLAKSSGIGKASLNRSYPMIKRELSGMGIEIEKTGRTKDLLLTIKKLPGFKKVSNRMSDTYYNLSNAKNINSKNSLFFYEYLIENRINSKNAVTIEVDKFVEGYRDGKSRDILLKRLSSDINEKTDLNIKIERNGKDRVVYITEK